MMEKLSVPIAIIIAGGLVAGALYYSNQKPQIKIENKEVVKSEASLTPVTDKDHILGNPEAKMIIVEYSDADCPFCKVFHLTMLRVMDEYGKDGKVAWVYRHFPLDSLHPNARKKAESMECVGELGGNEKFWEFTNALYSSSKQTEESNLKELPEIAVRIGLNKELFEQCLASGKYAQKVESQYQDALKSEGKGTPHSFLIFKDGTKIWINGAMPYENLKQMLDAGLE